MSPRAATGAAGGQLGGVQEASALGVVRDLVAMTKPRITGMVLFTTFGGMWLAPSRPDLVTVLVTVLEVGLVVAAASALNCYLERDVDRRMHRTQERPLAARRVPAWSAVALGMVLAVPGLPALAFWANPLTALLALAALVIYVWIYTPMKRRSPEALLVGAIPGAMPPLIGWTAATGRVDLPGLVLFAILFVWQIPHFLSIALYLQDDYARGGLKVFPLERGEQASRRWIVGWSALQLAVALLPVPLGLAGPGYGVVALVAGLAYLAFATTGLRVPSERLRHWARGMMLASIAWLSVTFAALGLFAR